MAPLLAFSRFIDWINQNIGKVCDWLVLLACLVSSVNAMMRLGLHMYHKPWA